MGDAAAGPVRTGGLGRRTSGTGDRPVRCPGGRRLSLRARLALTSAAAVAVAIAAISALAWTITGRVLHDRVDETLRSGTTVSPIANRRPLAILLLDPDRLCRMQPELASDLNPLVGSIQIVRADGTSCAPVNASLVPIAPEDVAVARGERGALLRDGRTTDGTHVRLSVQPLGDDRALLISRDLTDIDAALRRLGLVLLVASGLGILGALGAGLLVARSALRPLDEVTRAAEHVADTQDLDVPLEVVGKDEIARLAGAFNRMTTALAAARARQQRLIADASHELRTPITSLRTNLELLVRSERSGRDLPPQDRRELLDAVTAQLGELGDLVTELTVLARDEVEFAPVELRLDELVAAAVERASRRGGQPIDAELTPWRLRGDPAALERAVLNVLDNAMKFSPTGGRVLLRLRPESASRASGDSGPTGDARFAGSVDRPGAVGARFAVLEIGDHGPGIPAEERELVFERFWRSPSARSVPGSGLGLAIVADTVTRHGGTVSVAEAPGGGALIRLRVPGSPADPGPGPAADPAAGPTTGSRPLSGDDETGPTNPTGGTP